MLNYYIHILVVERVDAELDEFLKYDFIPRSGGGIGITRD